MTKTTRMAKTPTDINLVLTRMAERSPELARAVEASQVFESAGFGADWNLAPDAIWKKAGLAREIGAQHVCARCDDQGAYMSEGNLLDADSQVWVYCDCARGQTLRFDVYQRRYKRYLAQDLPPHYARMSFNTWFALDADQRAGKTLAQHASVLFAEAWENGHWFTLRDVYARAGQAPPADLDVDVPRNSIVLYGGYGVGKTGLVCSIMQHLERVKPTLYLRVATLIEDVQNTYSDRREQRRDRREKADEVRPTRKQLMSFIKDAPILALDEFTLEIISSDRKEILEAIVRHRCGHNLPTLITTNSTPSEFSRQWDGRITDVLMESAHWIPMGGPGLRRKAQLPPDAERVMKKRGEETDG